MRQANAESLAAWNSKLPTRDRCRCANSTPVAYKDLQEDGAAGEQDYAGGQSHRANLAAMVQGGRGEFERQRGQSSRGGRGGKGGRGGGNVGRASTRQPPELRVPRISGPAPDINDARNVQRPARTKVSRGGANGMTVRLQSTRPAPAVRMPPARGSEVESARHEVPPGNVDLDRRRRQAVR
jgi:hypothetical protein